MFRLIHFEKLFYKSFMIECHYNIFFAYKIFTTNVQLFMVGPIETEIGIYELYDSH